MSGPVSSRGRIIGPHPLLIAVLPTTEGIDHKCHDRSDYLTRFASRDAMTQLRRSVTWERSLGPLKQAEWRQVPRHKCYLRFAKAIESQSVNLVTELISDKCAAGPE